MFMKAQRTGNWLEMLPFFASSGHYLYAKSAYLYLQKLHEMFLNGHHVVRRSDCYWAGLNGHHVIRRSDCYWAGLNRHHVVRRSDCYWAGLNRHHVIRRSDSYWAGLNGHHVIRRSDCYWAGLSTDPVIEQELMRTLKSRGVTRGMTRGKGMSELQLAKFILSTPSCLEMKCALEYLTEIIFNTSDQHKA